MKEWFLNFMKTLTVRDFVYAVIILLLIGVCSTTIKKCTDNNAAYRNNIEALTDSIHYYKAKDGNLVAALGYLDKINELLEKARKNELTQAEFLILKDFDLAELRSYEQAKELAVDMLKKWLTKYKFKDWTVHSSTGAAVTNEEKEARALDIANKLSDNNVWKSHGRPIGIQVLKDELHLKIIDFEEDSELSDIIGEYYDALTEYIRGHKFRFFFQTRLFI